MERIKVIAAISFLIFGLWTLRGDKIEDEDKKKSKFGSIITVAISSESHNPLFILMGTTVGMLIVDGIGILGGAWMCRHIPEKYIKWGAEIIFMIFGTITIYESVAVISNNAIYIVLYLIILGVLIYLFGVKFAYTEQVCNIVLDNKEEVIEKVNDIV